MLTGTASHTLAPRVALIAWTAKNTSYCQLAYAPALAWAIAELVAAAMALSLALGR